MTNTVDDQQLSSDGPSRRILGDYTPAKDVAREIGKHETTLLRLIPRELVLRVGKTPFVHTAGCRAWLLAGGKPAGAPTAAGAHRRPG